MELGIIIVLAIAAITCLVIGIAIGGALSSRSNGTLVVIDDEDGPYLFVKLDEKNLKKIYHEDQIVLDVEFGKATELRENNNASYEP